MSRRHHRKHRIKLKSLYVWHRYVGLAVCVFALILSVTGLLLNHTERFDLDSQFIQSGPVLDWYGIKAPDTAKTFQVDNHYVTLLGERLYLDTHVIKGDFRDLAGAVSLPGWIVVAVDDTLLLLTPTGELVERLKGTDGVPSGLRTLGMSHDAELVIDGSHAFYKPDAQFVTWSHWDGNMQQVEWVTPVTPPDELYRQLNKQYRGAVLPLERVILDLHSGRILSMNGVFIMDAAAILLIFLSITGFYMWTRRRR